MDEFKKYLQNNKSELDGDMPEASVWQKIQTKIKPKTISASIMPLLRWAAAACFILLAGMVCWYLYMMDKKPLAAHTNSLVIQNEKKPIPAIQQPIPREPEKVNKKNTIAAHLQANNLPAIILSKQKSIDPILKTIETGFIQVINLQKARISTTPMFAESPEYFSAFKQQLNEMEQDEQTIKKNMVKQGLNNNLLDQLINLYQQKLTILKQLQLEMNKTNNQFKQNRGPVDATHNYFLSI